MLMILMSIVCLLKTLHGYIRLADESLCSVNYVQYLYDMAHFRGYQLFPGWFQVISVVSWVVSNSSWLFSCGLNSFSLFQVVPDYSKYTDVFIKKLWVRSYPENSVGRAGLRKQCHNCYAKIKGLKETNYTKHLLIAH